MRDKDEPWIEQSDYGKLAAGIWLAVEVGEAKVVLVCRLCHLEVVAVSYCK